VWRFLDRLFWSNHDNHATRRSYLMNELKNNYAQLEYAKFQTHKSEFKRMVDRVHAATAGKRNIEVTQ
jgi:hypothetical protein